MYEERSECHNDDKSESRLRGEVRTNSGCSRQDKTERPKEFRCTAYECGKEFNSDQVKEYDKVEVQERTGPREYNPRLTD